MKMPMGSGLQYIGNEDPPHDDTISVAVFGSGAGRRPSNKFFHHGYLIITQQKLWLPCWVTFLSAFCFGPKSEQIFCQRIVND